MYPQKTHWGHSVLERQGNDNDEGREEFERNSSRFGLLAEGDYVYAMKLGMKDAGYGMSQRGIPLSSGVIDDCPEITTSTVLH